MRAGVVRGALPRAPDGCSRGMEAPSCAATGQLGLITAYNDPLMASRGLYPVLNSLKATRESFAACGQGRAWPRHRDGACGSPASVGGMSVACAAPGPPSLVVDVTGG